MNKTSVIRVLLLVLIMMCCAAVPSLAADDLRADTDSDGKITSYDAIYLLRHTFDSEAYKISVSGDVNADGKVTSDDAIYLLRHTFDPENYPILSPCSHVEAILPPVAPTCTQTGLTEGKYCSVCGEVLAQQEVLPIKDHYYSGSKCRYCGLSFSERYEDRMFYVTSDQGCNFGYGFKIQVKDGNRYVLLNFRMNFSDGDDGGIYVKEYYQYNSFSTYRSYAYCYGEIDYETGAITIKEHTSKCLCSQKYMGKVFKGVGTDCERGYIIVRDGSYYVELRRYSNAKDLYEYSYIYTSQNNDCIATVDWDTLEVTLTSHRPMCKVISKYAGRVFTIDKKPTGNDTRIFIYDGGYYIELWCEGYNYSTGKYEYEYGGVGIYLGYQTLGEVDFTTNTITITKQGTG